MTEEPLSVSKSLLREFTCVDQASAWAKRLTQSEARGPGDIENAWHRLESRYGVPWRTFWALRYRQPAEISAGIWLLLKSAYQAECERQLRKLADEVKITKAIAGPDDVTVAAAEAVLGAHQSAPPRRSGNPRRPQPREDYEPT